MPLETVLSIGIALAALIFTGLSFRRNANNDNAQHTTEQATMSADIRYIRSSIDEIKLENRAMKKDLDDIKVKVIAVEQSVESAHKRIDDIKK